tara:strand:+ start:62752 stop:63348 length:597 start_codon:yes stop_codon:yes gene_type:complete
VRIGIFGGTFDPIHNGHIAIAKASLEECALDEVVFVPAGNPWMKAGQEISPSLHRLTMTQYAIENQENFLVSRIEIDKTGPSYMVETLEQLQKEMGTNLHLILGADSVERFSEWKNPSRIVTLSNLIIVSRPHYKLPVIDSEIVRESGCEITTLSNINVNISASEIRKNVLLGNPIEEMVPKKVARYIKLNNLYKAGV